MISSTIARAQVRLIQWTDVHSSVETITQQMMAIDRAGQDFLQKNPRGEFIIHVIGDFTSINPQNYREGGWLSYEAIKLLRQRGYTVLFTPGNHDAFDWTVRIDGAQLFLEQMSRLKSWGVEILVTNLRKKSKALKDLTSSSYALRTLDRTTHIVGMTLPILMSKSNLNEQSAQGLFGKIETFVETFDRVLPEMASSGVGSLIFGIHQGHSKLATQVAVINQVIEKHGLGIRVPLLMGAHDHIAASYNSKGTHISDGGSHGSFNIIDLNRSGETSGNRVHHVSISEQKASEVRLDLFVDGEIMVNDFTERDIRSQDWLVGYHDKVKVEVEKVAQRLGRVLVTLENDIKEHKHHMKQGQTHLGSMLSESLVWWARQHMEQPGSEKTPVIAMMNSSAYRLETFLEVGDLTELTFREMYPFLTEASLHRLDGKTIKKMYFSLREFYGNSDPGMHSPQLNFDVREREGHLEIREDGKWSRIKNGKVYWVVLDGWLSDHLFGQSYRIPIWLGVLKGRKSFASESFQEILVRYLPRVLKVNQKRVDPQNSLLVCRQIFAL